MGIGNASHGSSRTTNITKHSKVVRAVVGSGVMPPQGSGRITLVTNAIEP
jgi:hypothetical protein